MRFPFFLLVTLILANCARSRTHFSALDQSSKRTGTFQVHSPTLSGSGTIVTLKSDPHSQIYLYSPFGSKISQLTLKNDSITFSTDTEEMKLSVQDSLKNSVLISIPIVCGDLFKILSGSTPSFIPDSLVAKSGIFELSSNETIAIVRKRDHLQQINYFSPSYTLALKNFDGMLFRSVKLTMSSKNYFQISYE